MKFCFRTKSEANTVEESMEGLDIHELVRYLGTLKTGTRMHLIVRPRPGFNVEAKRNYFHGPVLDWIVGRLHELGLPHGREQVRVELVKKFVGVDDEGNALSVAKYIEAMVEGDPRDPETKYGDLISDVRNWCRDVLNGEPPRPDQVDLAEELTTCAKPEMTT